MDELVHFKTYLNGVSIYQSDGYCDNGYSETHFHLALGVTISVVLLQLNTTQLTTTQLATTQRSLD